jgi:hypothetical protein
LQKGIDPPTSLNFTRTPTLSQALAGDFGCGRLLGRTSTWRCCVSEDAGRGAAHGPAPRNSPATVLGYFSGVLHDTEEHHHELQPHAAEQQVEESNDGRGNHRDDAQASRQSQTIHDYAHGAQYDPDDQQYKEELDDLGRYERGEGKIE